MPRNRQSARTLLFLIFLLLTAFLPYSTDAQLADDAGLFDELDGDVVELSSERRSAGLTAAPYCCKGCSYPSSCCCAGRGRVPVTVTRFATTITATVTANKKQKHRQGNKANAAARASSQFTSQDDHEPEQVDPSEQQGSAGLFARHLCPSCPAGAAWAPAPPASVWKRHFNWDNAGYEGATWCCPPRKTTTVFKQTRTIYVTKTNAVANKAVVQGTLYFDIDGNGAYTAGVDLPLANTAIVLRRTLVANNSNKKLLLNRVAGTGTQIGSTTTDANGVYKFTVDKYPGETLTIHISSTDAQVGSVTVDATGGSSGETVLAPSAIIQGNIWQDDGNGIFDVGLDIPLSSVVVDIRLETGEELVGSVTTDSDGHFGLVTVPYVSAAMKIVAGDGTVLASFATDETGAAVVDVPIGATTSPTLLVATTRRIVQTTKRVVKTTSKLVATTSKKPTTRPIIRTTSKRIVPTTSKKIIATTKAPVPTTKAAAVPTTKAVVTTTKAPAPLVTTAHVTRTVTPTMNPSNTILKAGCTYLPVPYELPTAGDTQSTVFNIELISCVSDASINAVFVTAAQRWMKIITGDLLDVTNTRVTMPIADCITDSSNVRMLSCGFVDDLIIGFSVFAIDGVGGTLAQALPLYSRPDSYASNPKLPISGYMEFDSADWSDLQSKGTLQTVVTHEMGHVLGFGTKWLDFSMLSPATCDTLTPPFTASFTGTNAIAALPLINYNGGSVPVEDTGGAGTSCGHWKESIMKSEIMTGTVSTGQNYLSLLTAYQFKDLGYTINAASSAIDPFNQQTAPARRASGEGQGNTTVLAGCLKGYTGPKYPQPL